MASNGRGPSARLRNADYMDRELLHVVADCSAGAGWASTAEIVEALNLVGEGPGHAVSTRMSWMVRYGFCQRNPDLAGHYRLTRSGRNLMGGELSPEVQQAISKMSHGDRLLVMREVSQRSLVRGSETSSHLFRREFLHHVEDAKARRRV